MLNEGSNTPIAKINEICEALEPVALQIIEQIESDNPLSEVFTKDKISTGSEVEYMLIQGANIENYDKTGSTTLAPRKLKKAILYFNEYDHKVFANTIYGEELRDIALYVVEKVILKEVVTSHSELNIGSINGTTIQEKCADLTIKLRDTIDSFLFKNDRYLGYNKSVIEADKIRTKTRMDNIRILMPYTIRNIIDISYLASAYNLSKAEIDAKIITIDTADNILYVVDRRSIFKYPKYNELVLEQINAQGLFRNVFLHQNAMFGYCGLYKFAFIDCSTLFEEEPQPEEKCILNVTISGPEDFMLTLYDSNMNEVLSKSIDDNVVTFEVEEGTYTANATATGYENATETITILSTDIEKNVTITMTPETPVIEYKEVAIMVMNETTFSDLAIEVLDSENNVVTPSESMETMSVYDLSEGNYSYSVSATGFTTATGTISVTSADYGESDTIEITLIEA